jgi:UDP-N-acetylglucosamine/UDP-N-acetylgalactosamine diphosphorylase
MFVMTSSENHEETTKFFSDNKYFGASEENFVFFKQEMIPALDKNGKILMESKSKVKLVPNGNGSFFDVMDDNRELFAKLVPFEYL